MVVHGAGICPCKRGWLELGLPPSKRPLGRPHATQSLPSISPLDGEEKGGGEGRRPPWRRKGPGRFSLDSCARIGGQQHEAVPVRNYFRDCRCWMTKMLWALDRDLELTCSEGTGALMARPVASMRRRRLRTPGLQKDRPHLRLCEATEATERLDTQHGELVCPPKLWGLSTMETHQ